MALEAQFTEQLTFTCTPAMRYAIDEVAETEKKSLGQVVRELVDEAFAARS